MYKTLYGCVLLTIACMSSSQAGVGLGSTRVIYPAASAGVPLEVHNAGSGAFLVQPFVSTTFTERRAAPFRVSPLLFRLEGHSANTLRISALPDVDKLPPERESLFWLSVRAVPASSPVTGQADEHGVSGGVKLALGNTIKLIYRPASLSAPGEKEFGVLTFSATGNALEVRNPSPYYINLSNLTVKGKPIVFSDPGQAIVPPYDTVRYPLQSGKSSAKVQWAVFNDLGGQYEYEGEIQ